MGDFFSGAFGLVSVGVGFEMTMVSSEELIS